MSLTSDELQDLYRRYGRAVRARCRAMCGDTDADEALQEAFLAAWRARDRFDGRHPLAWLQTIARNASLDILRRRRPWVDDADVWLRLPAPTPASGSERADVGRLLADLSAEDAALLRMRYVEGWRIAELAEHFDTSERTLRRTLERLEGRARAILRTDEVDHG
ncbi:MAG: sigma-70 family RNA polymerase sigma factor [Alphaproteobacteria bacterium]|nr:sigma-70 family RNA polymerase sigma factor [Alphaproteobacteria bacterium]